MMVGGKPYRKEQSSFFCEQMKEDFIEEGSVSLFHRDHQIAADTPEFVRI